MFVTVNVPAGSNVDGVWAPTGGGSWAAGELDGGVPALAGDSANFGNAITGAATVNLDGSRTAGRLSSTAPTATRSPPARAARLPSTTPATPAA